MSETNARSKESDHYDTWFRKQVEEGLASAREEKTVTNEEVESRVCETQEFVAPYAAGEES